jgi:hypothetical protein
MDAFVILTHVSKPEHHSIWQRCVESVKKWHPESKIIIIDDNSSLPIVTDIPVIRSEFPGAGEILPYYYFAKYQWARRMIVLHDSMFLQSRIPLGNFHFKFLWSFKKFKHVNETDISKYLGMINQDFLHWNTVQGRLWWLGCFGVASVISLNLIKFLEMKYNIWNIWTRMTRTKSDRCVLERAFAIVMFAEGIITLQDNSLFGCKNEFEDHELEFFLKDPPEYKKYPVIKVCYGR